MAAPTPLETLVLSYIRADIGAEELLRADAWRGADGADKVAALESQSSSTLDGPGRMVALWDADEALPRPGRATVQALIADPATPDETRKLANEHWLETPLDDLSSGGLLKVWPEHDLVWVWAITEWGRGTLAPEVFELMLTKEAPAALRTRSQAELSAWAMFRAADTARSQAELSAVLKTLVAINQDKWPGHLGPVLEHTLDAFFASFVRVKADWSKAPAGKDLGSWLRTLKKIDHFQAKDVRPKVTEWQRLLKTTPKERIASEGTKAVEEPPKKIESQDDFELNLRELPLAERSERIKALWAEGWDPKRTIISSSGRALFQERLTELERRLDEVRVHKQISHDLSGDGWHDNPGLNQLRLEEERMMKDVFLRQRELTDSLEVDVEPRPCDRVSIGSIVRYSVSLNGGPAEEAGCEIVGSGEEDAAAHKLSYRSPISQALRGLPADGTRTMELPAGTTTFRVVSISPAYVAG